MAAIIRFPNGMEATLFTESGKWKCDNEDLEKILDMVTELLPYAYYPDPVEGLASDVAKEVGAEVIHVDPRPKRKRLPEMIE